MKRRALLGAAGALTVGGALGLLGGCAAGGHGQAAVSAASPTPSGGVIEIGAALDVGALGSDGSAQERAQLFGEVLRRFEAVTPGVRVRYYPFMQGINTMTPAILAGTGPDVFPDCCVYGEYAHRGLLLQLDPLLKRDNVNLAIWSPSQVATFDTGYGTFALSRNVDSYAFALRLDVLDSLGLPYPSVNWTYQEFSQLAAATTAPLKGQPGIRYGAGFQDGFLDLPQILPGFGGDTTAAGRTRQALSAPAGVAATRWLFHNLFWPGVATPSTSWAGGGNPNLGNGKLVIQEFQINQLLPSYLAWRNSFKWVFYPPPIYPVRRSNPVSNDFWGISANTKHPDQAWELLKWLAAGKTFQRMMMKTFLFSPALNDLWAEWQATVEGVVPGLKGKGLHWFATAAQQGWGTAQPYFRHASAQALAIDGAMWGDLIARRSGVVSALRAADAQVNALQQAAAAEAARQGAAQGAFPVTGPRIAAVAPGQ